ncbi:MAG TPA: RHS repeat-associated core domain-containing protein, partial [Blastocatellia bacterium]
LMTLDPTHGTMVPYGTGAVTADGTQIVPDPDPAHPGHLYGLVHFDWHAPMPPLPTQSNPCPCGAPDAADPVDVGSGLQVLTATDISIGGSRGSISVQRIYRTLSTDSGPFGPGSQTQYGWELDTGTPNTAAAINLIDPDGNRYLFSRQTNGTLKNASIPWLQGAVMTTNAANEASLRFSKGTVYQFQPFGTASAVVSITDRNGNVTTLTIITPGVSGQKVIRISQITDPVGRSLNLAYDGGGHVTSIADPIGRVVSYAYNSSGTLASMTNPAGGVTTFQYDSQNRMISMTDPRGVTMFQDTFDANGRVIQQVAADGGIYQFAYTLINPTAPTSPVLATTVTDPLGHQTTYRFNPQGYVIQVTDALGQTMAFNRAPGANLLLSVTGNAICSVCGPPGQGNVSYTYDANGNVLTRTDAVGHTTSFTYDPVFNQVTSVTDPLNHSTQLAYDGSGNLTSVTDANGHATSFTYDFTGLPLTSTDPLGNITTINYDLYGNPVKITDALGNANAVAFDGVSRMTGATDPLGRRSAVAYDVLDRVTAVQDGRGNVTGFAYDPVGNLLTLTDPRSNNTLFTYDQLSRLKTRTSAVGKSESYQYDAGGNLTQYTDRRGQASLYQYDALNRLAQETYTDATVTRAYDAYSRAISISDSQGGLFGFAYDADGSLISQASPTGSIAYTRDALERVATRQVAGQTAVTYAYDAVGNMLSASMAGAGVNFTYDPRNEPTKTSRTNGVASTTTYDPLGRVLSIVHANGPTALNTQTYAYDPSGSLVGASNDIAQPLITQAAAATVDPANELLTNGPTTYTSDANGNRLTETNATGTTTYHWDGRNRLSSITEASGNTIVMRYDFARNLMEIDRTTSGSTTTQKFLVGSLTNVVSLTDPSGLPVSVLTGRSIDSHYASIDSAGNVAFGIGDQLGSTTAVTSTAGAVAAKLDYEPYGQTTGSPPPTYPFAYTGRVPVVGNVYYYRARFYDVGVGRFLSEDPDGSTSFGSSLYSYVGNDPIDGKDPQGLRYWSRTFWTWIDRRAGQFLMEEIGKEIEEYIPKKGAELIAEANCYATFAFQDFELSTDILADAALAGWAPAIIATGPIGWAIGGGFALYQIYETYKDARELYKTAQNIKQGCSCAPESH